MARPHLFLVVGFILLFVSAPGAATRAQTRDVSPFSPMRNRDVLILVSKKIPSDDIITMIKSSWCNFDTFPPVLQELKRRGVPEEVLQAMVDAPYGPPTNNRLGGPSEQPIYHYAEQLKDLGFLTVPPLRRGEQSSGFSADRRGSGGILRK